MVNEGMGCQHPLLSFSHTFRRTGGQKNEHTEALSLSKTPQRYEFYTVKKGVGWRWCGKSRLGKVVAEELIFVFG
jgi:hypothetical protein